MPLVVMVGLPSCGKSTRSHQLAKYFEDAESRVVHIVSDHDVTPAMDKNAAYADSKLEREQRGELRSRVQKLISRNDIVILDAMNYIKGFRYELFCICKSAQTQHCVIHSEVGAETAKKFNRERSEEDRYSDETVNAIAMRFETPDGRNRWDSPLFVVRAEQELPFQEISDTILQKKAAPPNFSTQSQPLTASNFLHDLDKVTQEVLTAVMDMQQSGIVPCQVKVARTEEKVELFKTVSIVELRRLKRQFVQYIKSRPLDETANISSMFVQFLNNRLH